MPALAGTANESASSSAAKVGRVDGAAGDFERLVFIR
jgi:hypothetical protein